MAQRTVPQMTEAYMAMAQMTWLISTGTNNFGSNNLAQTKPCRFDHILTAEKEINRCACHMMVGGGRVPDNSREKLRVSE